MVLRSLARNEVETESWRVWNAFVDLLALEDFDDLSTGQRPAHLIFWYESEVQNGGHFQFFENRDTIRLVETVEALGVLGATCHQEILQEAGSLWLSRTRLHPQTAQEFSEMALEGEMDSFDTRFHACVPSLNQVLEEHLQEHQSLFIRVI